MDPLIIFIISIFIAIGLNDKHEDKIKDQPQIKHEIMVKEDLEDQVIIQKKPDGEIIINIRN